MGQNRIPAGLKAINWLLDSIKSLWLWKVCLKFKKVTDNKGSFFFSPTTGVTSLLVEKKNLGQKEMKIETSQPWFFGLYLWEPEERASLAEAIALSSKWNTIFILNVSFLAAAS